MTKIFTSDAKIVSVLHMTGRVSVIHNQFGIITVKGVIVQLTAQEKSLLLYLAEGKGQVRTKTMLLSHVAQGKNLDYKLVDVLVCKIRAKLRHIHPDASNILRSVWGRGYAWGLTEINSPADWNPCIPHTNRWTIARKAMLVEALLQYRIDVAEVERHYPDLSIAELCEWNREYRAKGQRGLRTTHPNVMGYKLAA